MFGQQHDDQPMDAGVPQPMSDPAAAMPATMPQQDLGALPAMDATNTSAPLVGYGDGSMPAPLSNAPAPTAPSVVEPASDDLLNIKQQALQQLTPLVGHLDQTPEEKFRTTMMMIQASDNADLINQAYAAAEQITDEKAKAQALLDIVNEINYFTQHHD